VNGDFLCKSNNKATFSAASVSLLLKNTTIQQSCLDLGKRQLIRLAFKLSVIAVHILVAADFLFDLFDLHMFPNTRYSHIVQHHANSSNNTFASCKSFVSNPSVNQL